MMRKIEDYRNIVGDEIIAEIEMEAAKIEGKNIAHINSTYFGGGVAEILESYVPLLNSLGIKAEWDIIKGSPEFYTITKKFHNALQGSEINLTAIKKEIYLATNELNSIIHRFDQDLIIIHDPQPLPLIKFCEKKQPWIWRCHIDLSNPNRTIWNFLKPMIEQYDAMIVHLNEYKRKDLRIPQHSILPAIDPLSSKNQELSDYTISKYLYKYKIERNKPIITQVSRFDKWKNPLRVIEIYQAVKKAVDCKLVLIGSLAWDDPEAPKIYQQVIEKIEDDEDVIVITEHNNILVNILQRVSSAVLQLSLKEGFGLTVSEAMWKGRPVIGSSVGGIPKQIKHGETGFLIDITKPDWKRECKEILIKLLKNEKLRERIGEKAREHVRKHFLLPRYLLDEIRVCRKILASG